MMLMKEFECRKKVTEHMKKHKSKKYKLVNVDYNVVYKINERVGFEVTFKFLFNPRDKSK